MKLYSIIFVAFLEFFFLQTAKADIPGCHFLETVNITSSQSLQNGSYMYQDIEIPEHLTGQYNYITTEKGIQQKVNSHLRGCVCHLKPCIWICCRFKDWDSSNGKCTDGLTEKLSKINPFLEVTLNNGSVVKRNLLKDFIVLRDRMRYDDTWQLDKYTLFENGSVLFNSANTVNFRGYDCLHPNQLTSGSTEYFVATFHSDFYYEKPLESVPQSRKMLIWLSNAFLVLTIAVYLYVRKLRNLHGKCFICYMITTFMFFTYYLLITESIPLQLCALHGYCFLFFYVAKFTWLFALSHQLWRGFTSINRAEFEYSFGAYSIFAWGLPVVLTGITLLIDQIWDGDPNKVAWVPGLGWQRCFLKSGLSYDGYVLLPTRTLIALNTILIILIAISFIRIKLSLRHFSDQDERARNLNSRMQTYKVFLRLIVLMDIQWSVRVINFYVNSDLLLEICKYCDCSIGIIIFVMFVLKRSTLKLLKER
ncbi:probable G-protein coupled receptor Mth-like 6 [Drosophila kikkawai]|uniref:Probable G-protein coupled receptor Mth-like 6 n=1 Tax=Drosophila kikkawai TaxID=30033 RepID=A0ABM4GI16_DROKI